MRIFLSSLLLLACAAAQASMGLVELPGRDGDGVVTVFYPSDAEAKPLQRGPFTVNLAVEGTPKRGIGRLVVISHGSGGSAWTYTDLAAMLVAAGYAVAAPLHQGDNFRDLSKVGPSSWRLRPAEVSRAIDAVGRDPRFAQLLQLDRVGVFGMSAGGHTALSMAGGRWSPAGMARHCNAHIGEDFPACVGLATSLDGGAFDGLKKSTARWLLSWRFADGNPVSHEDARVKAVVAAVPYAADFDMASFAAPRVPLGLALAGQDKWLAPRFHGGAVRAACKPCEVVADLPAGGHGAYLSPLPPALTGRVADLLNDPPGFDRKSVAEANRRIVAFFHRHLLP
ncbi:MAG: alpha/beta hydrolase family protein [Betaproteobacteria bacterium]